MRMPECQFGSRSGPTFCPNIQQKTKVHISKNVYTGADSGFLEKGIHMYKGVGEGASALLILSNFS